MLEQSQDTNPVPAAEYVTDGEKSPGGILTTTPMSSPKIKSFVSRRSTRTLVLESFCSEKQGWQEEGPQEATLLGLEIHI